MTAEEYADWCQEFAEAMALRSAEDAAMLAAWGRSFRACGYRLDDLCEATVRLMRSPPEVGEYGHESRLRRALLARIHGHVADVRDEDEKRRRAYRDPAEVDDGDRGECPDCRGCGVVSVPHPDHVPAAGAPATHAAAVFCHCGLGRRSRQAWERVAAADRRVAAPPPEFHAYAAWNPHWRSQMAAAHAAAVEWSAAREATESADLAGAVNAAIGRARR